MPLTPNRREFLVGAGVATVGLAAVGCGDNLPPYSTIAAAAVLEPTSDALILVVWARDARAATVELRAGDAATTLSLAIDPATGSGAIDIGGLVADTDHELAIALDDGTRLRPVRARTAPRVDDPRPVRLAVVADIDPNPEFDTDIANHVAAAEPDLLVAIGDFPYTDNGPVALTPSAYRDRHAEIRTLPRIRTLLDAMPMRAIYDDHEFRNNWDAMFVATEPDRYLASMVVWDEFFPLRDASGEIRYRSWRQGANVECFMLDCRRFRGANAALDTAEKTMLGATQRAWFVDAIQRSTAPFKLVFSSVPLDFGNGDDHWAGYTTERNAIFDALVGISGVVFLSADQHWFASHRHRYGIREFQCGPLCRGILVPPPPVDGVLYRNRQYNAALIDIDATHFTITGIGPGGERFFTEKLTAAELTPKR
jgi:phosphodiesterase/alkaline phosphatase D-like protein